MHKKPLTKLQYKIDWNSQTIESDVTPPSGSRTAPVIPANIKSNNNNNNDLDNVPLSQLRLERGSINLNNSNDRILTKKQKPVKEKVSNFLYDKFSKTFLRSKSMQSLSNDDYTEDQPTDDTVSSKATTSMKKLKKQAKVIDVQIYHLNEPKSSSEGKTLLKNDGLEYDL